MVDAVRDGWLGKTNSAIPVDDTATDASSKYVDDRFALVPTLIVIVAPVVTVGTFIAIECNVSVAETVKDCPIVMFASFRADAPSVDVSLTFAVPVEQVAAD